MEEWIDILLKDPCSYCGGISDTIDHITALENGGRHQVTNVTGCCFSCNSAKKDKSLFVFLAERQLDLELLNSQI